jgi:ABC-type Mn2+/Zn2+ transport system ATPase subunit
MNFLVIFKVILKIYGFKIISCFLILKILLLYLKHYLFLHYINKYLNMLYKTFNFFLFKGKNNLINIILKKFFEKFFRFQLINIGKKYLLQKLKNKNIFNFVNNNELINFFFVFTNVISIYIDYLLSLISSFIFFLFFFDKILNIKFTNLLFFFILILILNYFIDYYSNKVRIFNNKFGIRFDKILSYLKITGNLDKNEYIDKLNVQNKYEINYKTNLLFFNFIKDILFLLFIKNLIYLDICNFIDYSINFFIFNKKIYGYITDFYNVLNKLKIKKNKNKLDYNKNLISYSFLKEKNFKKIYYNKFTKLTILQKQNNDNNKILIKCNNISIFNNFNINLEIFENNIIIIEGPSGSGKSTLIKSIIDNSYLLNGKYILKNINYKNIFYIPSDLSHLFNPYNSKLFLNLIKKKINMKDIKEIINILDFNIIYNLINKKKINFNYFSEGEKRKLLLLIFTLKKNIKLIILDDVFIHIKLYKNLIMKFKQKLLDIINKNKITAIYTNYNDYIIKNNEK